MNDRSGYRFMGKQPPGLVWAIRGRLNMVPALDHAKAPCGCHLGGGGGVFACCLEHGLEQMVCTVLDHGGSFADARELQDAVMGSIAHAKLRWQMGIR